MQSRFGMNILFGQEKGPHEDSKGIVLSTFFRDKEMNLHQVTATETKLYQIAYGARGGFAVRNRCDIVGFNTYCQKIG